MKKDQLSTFHSNFYEVITNISNGFAFCPKKTKQTFHVKYSRRHHQFILTWIKSSNFQITSLWCRQLRMSFQANKRLLASNSQNYPSKRPRSTVLEVLRFWLMSRNGWQSRSSRIETSIFKPCSLLLTSTDGRVGAPGLKPPFLNHAPSFAK